MTDDPADARNALGRDIADRLDALNLSPRDYMAAFRFVAGYEPDVASAGLDFIVRIRELQADDAQAAAGRENLTRRIPWTPPAEPDHDSPRRPFVQLFAASSRRVGEETQTIEDEGDTRA